MAARNPYLNNKELLREIHNSKTSFCEFEKPEYHRYDAIVEDYDDLFVTDIDNYGNTFYPVILEAQEAKAARMAAEDYAAKMVIWEQGPKKASDKPRLVDCKFDPTILDEDELIYRVMTYEHIPLEPGRKKNPRKESEHYARLNFIPFKHYMITDKIKHEAREVGRSHYKDGEYCLTHGAMTDKLAVMYMLLVERYSQRSNWRGYTYLDEMKGQSLLQLSTMGLQFNEAKSNNPFAYYTQALTHSFTRVLNIEKKNQDIRDKILVSKGLTPSFSKQIEHENKLRQMREDAASESENNK